MNARQAVRLGLDMADFVAMAYLNDLNDDHLLIRPCAGANHIAWQMGHLIVSEHQLIEVVCPGNMPALPENFAAKYTKETAIIDDAAAFHGKADLLAAHQAQRAATLVALEALSDADLNRPSGVDYAPTVGGIFSLQGSHWLMHAGQWVIIRRQLGKPALF